MLTQHPHNMCTNSGYSFFMQYLEAMFLIDSVFVFIITSLVKPGVTLLLSSVFFSQANCFLSCRRNGAAELLLQFKMRDSSFSESVLLHPLLSSDILTLSVRTAFCARPPSHPVDRAMGSGGGQTIKKTAEGLVNSCYLDTASVQCLVTLMHANKPAGARAGGSLCCLHVEHCPFSFLSPSV